MRGSIVLAIVLAGCGAPAPELSPTSLSQNGGEQLRVRVDEPIADAVIVLVDGVATHSTVVEAPDLLRVRVPSLPRVGTVAVELLRADGSRVQIGELEVTAPKLDVRARE